MALDAEDLKAIGKLIADSHAEGMTTALKPVLDRLKKVEEIEAPDVAKLIAQAMEDAKGKKKGDGDGDGKTTDAERAMAAKFTAMEAKLAASAEAAETADNARKSEKMLSALRTVLTAKKVPGARIDHVVALLHHAQGRIALDDNGQPTICFDRTSAGGPYQDHLTLDKGLDEFLGTPEGKSFLPASEVQGSKVHQASNRPMSSGGKLNVRSAQSALLGAAFNQ